MKCGNKDCNCNLFHEQTVHEVKDTLLDDQEYLKLANLFKVLSDPNRVKMIEAISKEELCVFDIAHLLGVTKSAISHQMRMLKEYDVVESRKDGKMVYYKLNNPFITELIQNAKKYSKEGLINA